MLFWAIGLAMAPLHISISQGQITLLPTLLIVLALRFAMKARPIAEGLCLGLAAAIKPQMALLLPLLPLFRGRWKATAAAAGMVVLVAVLAVGRMEISGVPWLTSLRANLGDISGGGHDDPAGPDKFLMVNLQPLLHTFTGSHVLAASISLTVVLASAAFMLWTIRSRRDSRTEVLAYAVIAILGLLAVYNRIYCATLLLLPLGWAMTCRPPRAAAVAAILMILPFMVPGPAALNWWAEQAHPSFAGSWWWRDTVLMHETFLLMVLSAAMIWCAGRERRTGAALGA